ncbi:uncharacterized protein DUF4352 [Brevibacterium sanguinis]|uniref:Uncharacterized protein DUF4352 n=2 Tax=Brevibacterium TaxID=1696 RepID=A0A366IJB0_9MICO|nr:MULTISPECIES: DUF4352 domain-containing protein [Brevibacterium]RBP63925.1 uncharacterized protein DUF4352 [Brevibacterium sanguinis]RBP70800.1 uncharacterized protein DUF4352 [Brevibacterium celere]
MSTPQNPYEPNRGTGNQNSNDQSSSGSSPVNGGQGDGGSQPQYGTSGGSSDQPTRAYESNQSQDPTQQYGSAPQYGSSPQYGSQPNYGGQNDSYGQSGQGDSYGQSDSQGYGQGSYGQNQYDPHQYGGGSGQGGYDQNQYAQQPAYAAAGGGSDQFIPANPNSGYGSYPPGSMGGNTSKNIWGILALIGGIVGIVLSWAIFGAIFGIAGLIFGFIGLGAVKKGLATNRGLNIWGIILSGVAILLSIVFLIGYIAFGAWVFNEGSKAIDSYSPTAPAPVDPSQPGFESPDSGDSSGTDAAPAPVEGGEVEIGTDVTAAVSVASGTVDEYAVGAESTNGEVAVVSMTVKNNSSSELDLSLSSIQAENGSGATYQDVFDGSKYQGILAFADPVPAGGEKTYEFAFGVPASEVDQLHLKFSLFEDLGKGTEFEFSKAA